MIPTLRAATNADGDRVTLLRWGAGTVATLTSAVARVLASELLAAADRVDHNAAEDAKK